MSDYNTNPAARYGATARTQVAIDEGLRAYMLRVYNYMALGLAITGAAALATFMMAVDRSGATYKITAFGALIYQSPLKWVVIFAPLAFVLILSFGIQKLSAATAQLLFWLYAATVGLSLSVIFLVFTGQSIVQVFFITAASFGALSLYGYTTKRDLSAMGAFLIMGLFGIIIASVVNVFFASSMMQWIISVVGVFIFAGLTAYDTQRIKEMYLEADDSETAGRKAVMGALSLYLDFINLFMMLLQIFGGRRD
ncbi:MAG TPA: Bax inhibitor-1/YccA family protein [Xanthobacteraceae bacterium]|nr:Bax inhibitor-1/YccA family protein [Xanthobacteraceae bacterium]